METTLQARMNRYMVVGLLVLIAFFLSYRYAVAQSEGSQFGEVPIYDAYGNPVALGGQGAGGGSGCACCGPTGSGEPIEGSTTLEGDVQAIFVDASAGYDPNVIRAQAGVPIEITFSQGAGCMAQVMSRDLGFFEDLTTGSKTITLPALEPGEYGFSCGMEMVFGTIVVE